MGAVIKIFLAFSVVALAIFSSNAEARGFDEDKPVGYFLVPLCGTYGKVCFEYASGGGFRSGYAYQIFRFYADKHRSVGVILSDGKFWKMAYEGSGLFGRGKSHRRHTRRVEHWDDINNRAVPYRPGEILKRYYRGTLGMLYRHAPWSLFVVTTLAGLCFWIVRQGAVLVEEPNTEGFALLDVWMVGLIVGTSILALPAGGYIVEQNQNYIELNAYLETRRLLSGYFLPLKHFPEVRYSGWYTFFNLFTVPLFVLLHVAWVFYAIKRIPAFIQGSYYVFVPHRRAKVVGKAIGSDTSLVGQLPRAAAPEGMLRRFARRNEERKASKLAKELQENEALQLRKARKLAEELDEHEKWQVGEERIEQAVVSRERARNVKKVLQGDATTEHVSKAPIERQSKRPPKGHEDLSVNPAPAKTRWRKVVDTKHPAETEESREARRTLDRLKQLP